MNELPPNSPVITERWLEPGAITIAEAPAERKVLGKLKTVCGAVQVPGAPGTNVACVESARTICSVNSDGAAIIPVEQSTAVESSSPPIVLMVFPNCPVGAPVEPVNGIISKILLSLALR
jgi:hypothetical protein